MPSPRPMPRPQHSCKLIETPRSMRNVGTWLSLVEHSLGVRGVGSSNLPVPTIAWSRCDPLGSPFGFVVLSLIAI